jgi:diaminopimelate epimerase
MAVNRAPPRDWQRGAATLCGYIPAMGSPFIKMNGLGNDFVIVAGDATPSAARVRAIADRETGIGCDQFILLGPSLRGDVAMRIWNPDGSPAERCGNAERCVAWLTMKSRGRCDAVLENGGRLSYAKASGDGAVTVDMGTPGLDWRDIPLAWEMDTRKIELRLGDRFEAPGCVSMGNPHVVFFVPDAEAAPVATTGPIVEKHWLFPERVNVGFAEVVDSSRIRLRVWERGAGLTRACGTGACAALVAAHRRGLVGRSATMVLDGGELMIEWREADDHVLMTGPVAVEFTGRLPELELQS